MQVDPIAVEIIKGALKAAGHEMGLLIERTAMSPFIREKKDFYAALFDGAGRLIVGSNLPVFGDVVGPVAEHYPLDSMRPGDIYTHCYSGLRRELTEDGKVNPGMFEGRKRGVLFDVGHGGGSFSWGVAIPALKEGFLPDTISTDLHIGSMNTGMK